MGSKETRVKSFWKPFAGGLALLTVAGVLRVSCDRERNEYTSFNSHPVDQVFRDHDGIRLIHTDSKGIIQESEYSGELVYKKYYMGEEIENVPIDITNKFKYVNDPNRRDILIIKDLNEGERGYANLIKYNQIVIGPNQKRNYLEVHLPKDSRISPGKEVFGNKPRIEAEMNEVK